jgi:hypothetical protein
MYMTGVTKTQLAIRTQLLQVACKNGIQTVIFHVRQTVNGILKYVLKKGDS